MTKPHFLCYCALACLISLWLIQPLKAEEPGMSHPEQASLGAITLSAGSLTATFTDNQAFGPFHAHRYNGVASLSHQAAPENVFVPEYAGFNVEHYFGGDKLQEFFEPREHPMILTRLDEQTVRLWQPPTPLSKTEITETFRMAPPNCIDVTVSVVFHDLGIYQHGYAGVFWASYINKPPSKSIHFPGVANESTQSSWIEAYSETHGEKSSHLYAGDSFKAWFTPDFNVSLANHFSDYRFTEPFYYGLHGKMALAFFFEQPEGIRFSQSPTGGGPLNPAWDFQFIAPSPEIEKSYGFRARILYKPFVSNEDIRQEFMAWKAQLKQQGKGI